jgi:hypothetical protein
MSQTNLQVPLSSAIKDKALKKAEDEGFSSLQELVRVFLTMYGKGKVSMALKSENDTYTPKQIEEFDTLARIAEQEYKRGDYIEVSTKKDLMKMLENVVNDKPILYTPES